jgi:hypothetical protein
VSHITAKTTRKAKIEMKITVKIQAVSSMADAPFDPRLRPGIPANKRETPTHLKWPITDRKRTDASAKPRPPTAGHDPLTLLRRDEIVPT